MSSAQNFASKILVLTVILLLPVKVFAFGAGDIPDFAYLNNKAFRHGDIENVLEELVKTAGGVAMGGGLLGIASSVITQVTGGSKFSKSDVKKVYFGNWLRDYSQAMDIAGLSKLTADSLILVVAVLGFMTFGFSTKEFEVTADRLGVYLPVEHIDNPKGYAEKEGDARKFHPKLRPPIQRQELEIDERTGMKNYMATENKGWDTSTAFIRRTFRSCIEHGRRARGNEGPDLWEAFRLLGTGLHTMEDLLAHSNWCEIALRKMGHKEVFCHVGDNVSVNTPNGRAPPLVTGTFGSADFLHSLIGETGDKLSQASVTDLSAKINNASQGGSTPDIGLLKTLFKKFGSGDDQKLNQGDEIQQQAKAYRFNPDDMAPPQVKKQLLDALKWHDDVMRDIISKIEMIPGLTSLLEEFSNALNAFIYTSLAPYIGPILTAATSALDEGSKLVIDNDDQYEVFNNPNAQDPSHSLLSKDHFGLILNEPAGKIAIVVVQHTVNLIVRAWNDNSNPDEVINRILEAFHHPYYATGRSEIQNRMFDEMKKWMGEMGGEAQDIIKALTKDAVRNHRNKRKGLGDEEEPGYAGCGHKSSSGKTTGVAATGYGDQSHGGYQSNTSNYGKSQSSYGKSDVSNTYGQSAQQGSYGSQRRNDNYDDRRGDADFVGAGKYQKDSSNRRDDDVGSYGTSGYGSQQGGHGQKRDEPTAYAPSYGKQDYGSGNTGYGAQRRDATSYDTGYQSNRPNESSLGTQRREDPAPYGSGYQSNRPHEGVGYDARTGRREDSSYGGGYESQTREDSGKGHGSNKYRDDGDNRGTYGGGNTQQQSYGRREESGTYSHGSSGSLGYGQNQPSHGGYAPPLVQTESSSYGTKKHGKKDHDDDARGGYGRKTDRDDDSDDSDKKRKQGRVQHDSYGRVDDNRARKDKDDSDDDESKRHGTHKNRSKDRDDDRSKGYNQPSYGQSGYNQSSSGYAPSYEGGDTYGVERLNIGGRGRDGDRDDGRKTQNKPYKGGY